MRWQFNTYAHSSILVFVPGTSYIKVNQQNKRNEEVVSTYVNERLSDLLTLYQILAILQIYFLDNLWDLSVYLAVNGAPISLHDRHSPLKSSMLHLKDTQRFDAILLSLLFQAQERPIN